VKGKAMSKIYEALQNAERENGAALKKASFHALKPKEERTERREENAERECVTG